MRNGPYFHVGYAPKIKSGASHNIKFQKTKFSQKITSKIFFKVIFLEIQSCLHVFWPNSGNEFLIFFENLTKNFKKNENLEKKFQKKIMGSTGFDFGGIAHVKVWVIAHQKM